MVDNSAIDSAATKHFDFSISGLILDSDQTPTLVWFSDYSPSGNKNINFGIDNFKLGTVWTVPCPHSSGCMARWQWSLGITWYQEES